LDGDELRAGLTSDLGFDEASRTENVRRVAELAKLVATANIAVFVALISPRRAMRAMAADIIGRDRFFEVFINCSADTCAKRDVKGHWLKATSGLLNNFTGVSAGYENPEHADLSLDTDALALDECCLRIAELVTAGKVC
jgi:adenylylsulfate kinase